MRTGPRARRLAHAETQQLAQQLRRRSITDRDAHHARQHFQERTQDAAAAGEISTDKPRDRAAAAVAQLVEILERRPVGPRVSIGIERSYVQVATHQVAIVLWEQNQIA